MGKIVNEKGLCLLKMYFGNTGIMFELKTDYMRQ